MLDARHRTRTPRLGGVSLRPSSLRGRVALVSALGAAAALLVGFTVLNVLLGQALRQAVDSGITARLDDLRVSLQDADLSVLRRDSFAELLRADGSVVASSATISTADADRGSALTNVLEPGELARALHGRLVVSRPVLGLGAEARLVAEPLPGRQRVLVVGASTKEIDYARDRVSFLLAVSGVVLLAGLASAGWLVAGAALRPVAALTDRAAAISVAGERGGLPVPPGDDELARLARTLNGMLSRLGESIERERGLLDDASHELFTPIAVLRGELELAALAIDEKDVVKESVHAALGETERLGRLTEDLLVLARGRAGTLTLERRPLELGEFARSVLDRLRRAYPLNVDVRGEPVCAEADPAQLERVLANVMSNAARAGARVLRVTTVNGAAVGWEIADDGPGIPPALLPTALDRFTRGDAARTRGGGGAGLGLAIVAAILAAHGGSVELANGPPLGGAVVRIRLPASGSRYVA